MTASPTLNRDDSLRGQVAMVTGGSKGIDLAIAQTFAAHGASVAAIARSEHELRRAVGSIEQAGGRDESNTTPASQSGEWAHETFRSWIRENSRIRYQT